MVLSSSMLELISLPRSLSLVAASLDMIVLAVAAAAVGLGGFILLAALLGRQTRRPPRVTGKGPSLEASPVGPTSIPPRGAATPIPHAGPPAGVQMSAHGAGVNPVGTHPFDNETGSPDEVDEIDEADEIYVVPTPDFPPADDGSAEELQELRLALEASQNELAQLSDSRNEALNSVSRHEQSVNELQQLLQQRDAECESFQQANQELTSQSTRLEQELDSVRGELAAVRADLEAADPELAIREAEQRHEQTLTELRTLLGQHEAAEASLQRERNDLATQLDDARRDLEFARTSDIEISAPSAPPTDEAQQFAALSASHDQVQSELSLANEQINQLHQNLNQRDAMVMELTHARNALTEELAATKERLAQREAEESAEATDAPSEVALAAHQEQLDRLREELEASQTRAEEASQAQLRLTESYEDALAENQSLQDRLSSVQTELHQSLQQMEARQPAAEVEAERDAALTELDGLRSELAQAKSSATVQRGALEAQLYRLQEQFEQAGVKVAKAEEKASKVETLDQHRRRLRQQLGEAQVEVQDLAVELSRRSDDLDQARLTQQSATAELDALRLEVSTLRQQADAANSAAREELERLATKLEARERECAEVIATRDELSSQVVALEANLASEQARATADAETLDAADPTLAARVVELESALEEQEHALQSVQAEKEDFVDRFGAAQEEIDAKAAMMKQLQKQLQEAETAAANADQLRSDLAEAVSARADSEAARASAIDNLQQVQRDQIELKQQLVCLIDETEALKAQRVTLWQQLGLDETGVPLAPEDGDSDSEPGVTVTGPAAVGVEQVEQLMSEVAEKETRCEALRLQVEELQSRLAEPVGPVGPDPDELIRLKADRDEAVRTSAEASKEIADLMAELEQLRSENSAASNLEKEKLEAENAEYRKSVAELHAVVNELEEMKLDRERDQDSARMRLQEATAANAELAREVAELKRLQSSEDVEAERRSWEQRLTKAQQAREDEIKTLRKTLKEKDREHSAASEKLASLASELESIPKTKKESGRIARESKKLKARAERQEKKIADQTERLGDLASRLSKARSEVSSLRSELVEHQAILRALNSDGMPTGRTNGKPAKASSSKREPTARSRRRTRTQPPNAGKVASKTRTGSKSGNESGKVFSQRPSRVDDLKKIVGVGPVLEKRLNEAGIYQFEQVKRLSREQVAHLDEHLDLGGRITRENWVQQAKKLAK